MAKPKLKPEIKTESLVSAAPRWNVVVLNDPINYQAYVVMAFMNVLRIGAPEAKRLMRAIHAEGRATVWTGDRERAEMLSLELQQWHLSSLLEQDG
ncbi:MAG: ATP-dependent Clp protease adaptor ClpS [Opitutales bacterium]|jgi:ATP-dependent Clp protease adaptor protein ClpS|nr:ATP-dependent Clp protease adaptor ClpS [Opitutales bacterium]MDP4658940.1 ATP-dependent Clp protease adaptor ClpS [Opitutales bacterium]MDP4774518.1 ATP-dependent Clp protease adaptor ClpS [Opitutales bacterium]MDP4788086.1 ATP-dependent Clp protease adaptor ClpS [Opitutales bacterium]MDP4860462.1 ATP-dependent Clp protease adaptor ClpS [Opitutales bacterium]